MAIDLASLLSSYQLGNYSPYAGTANAPMQSVANSTYAMAPPAALSSAYNVPTDGAASNPAATPSLNLPSLISGLVGGNSGLSALPNGGYTPPDITGTTFPAPTSPNTGGGVLGGIFGGSPFGSQNPSLNSLLQAIIPVGASLWQYLGSQNAYNNAGNLINNAEQNAAQGVQGATGNANNLLQQLMGGGIAATNPYTSAGAGAAGLLSSGLQPGGALNSNLTADQVLANDPGYQFRLGQGEGDLQARLAAEGLSGSGEAQKQLIDYQQNFASNEFQNAFARQQQQQQNLFSRLAGTSNLGLAGTGQALQATENFGIPQAANTIGSSVYGGNAGVTGAGALAGAQIDANAQKNQMIQNIMTALLGLFRNQPPTAAPATTGTGGLGGLLGGLLGG